MEGRSWSGGLHQAVEVKEGIELTDATQSHIQMSFQMFFRLYRDLAGMSGTLQNIEKELWRIYGLITVNIPTHAPKQLTVYPEKLCNGSDDKWDRVIDSVLTCVKQGRAVLVGTRSIRESESLYQKLFERGVDATVLNALRHEQEAQIIAHAGRRGRVTIATNMAGRGTDILVDPEVLQAGGLHVIATERHESRRVDMQLYGRTARQGLPGTAETIMSLEDVVMSRYCPKGVLKILRRVLHRRFGEKMGILYYRISQYRAERSRSRLRKKILEKDLALTKALSFTKY